VSLPQAPSLDLVFASEQAGVALLEGFSDAGMWRTLLPWPEELRELSWSAIGSWTSELEAMEREIAAAPDELEAPFLGGWVGFITYECGAFEEAALPRDANPPEPPLFFARHRAGVAIHPEGTAWLFCPRGEEEEYLARLQRVPSPAEPVVTSGALIVEDSLAGSAYREAVQTIREAILDGDVYQVNLTRTLHVRRPVELRALYDAMVGTVPPRMSAFLRAPGCAIVSASPEVLLRFDRVEGIAETRPIKGTIRREGDDASAIATLEASTKDAAEHLMIVDVSRNDLGKVAPPGEVRVTDFRRVRTLEYVHHLETTVEARGLRDIPVARILAALTPAASITGAPKRAAVRMIREIEPEPRGVYCGTIGFLGSRWVELSVAIRTAIVTDSEVRYHAGGGIVWDSNAEAEDEETRAKSAPFLRFLEGER
jgi:anthranilate synthase component 1